MFASQKRKQQASVAFHSGYFLTRNKAVDGSAYKRKASAGPKDRACHTDFRVRSFTYGIVSDLR